ncbi:MAG: iron ABC transporter permease, partial [Anaerolineales bacterium]|nr:iron ABC transporter permease [Anaerolineales bacterium]
MNSRNTNFFQTVYTSLRVRLRVFTFFRSSFSRLLLWLAPILFLLSFFFHPLSKILILAFNTSALTKANFQLILPTVSFTFYQATLSTILTFVLGLPSAILFSRFNFRGKSLLRALTAVPFMLPTVVVASSFNALFGNHGWLNVERLTFNVSSSTFHFLLILLAHIFYNTTIVIRIVGNALSRLDPKLEGAARSLGADTFRVWKNITLPLLRPSLLAAALLVFMFDFTSFGVILLLGGLNFSTLEVEIYLRVLKLPNLPLAALLSIVQLVFTLIFSILYTRTINQVTTQTAPRFSTARPPKTLRERIFVFTFYLLLVTFFSLPLTSLPIRSLTRLEADRGQRGEVQYGFTTDYYKELFINRRGSLFYVPPIQAARNSLGYASLTVLLSLALGYPAAYALAKPTRLEKFLDPLIMLPLGASAVMLGLGFIISFGRALASPWFVPIAHTLVALPFVIRTLQPALASIPERLRQAASTLGASPFRVWQTVDFPILSRATLSAATFAFTVSLGEFG